MNKFIPIIVLAICFIFSAGNAQDLTLTENFEGLQQSEQPVPDPVIAVGSNHVMLIVNSSIGIYNKSGTQISTTSLYTWFSSVIPSGDGLPYDPKIIYIGGSGLWKYNWGEWKNVQLFQRDIILSLSGNAKNDIFLTGTYGLLAHFNGVNWKVFSELSGATYSSISVKDNLVVAVGDNSPAAAILIGKRK